LKLMAAGYGQKTTKMAMAQRLLLGYHYIETIKFIKHKQEKQT
jgi:hypothetical protein